MSAITKRRRPQFSLRMLLIGPIVFGLCWCIFQWTTWPDRTIARFQRLIEADDFEAAVAMLECANGQAVANQNCIEINEISNDPEWPVSYGEIEVDAPETMDILYARRTCYLVFCGVFNGYSERRMVIVRGDAMTLHSDIKN